jgi:hypothetical protein
VALRGRSSIKPARRKCIAIIVLANRKGMPRHSGHGAVAKRSLSQSKKSPPRPAAQRPTSAKKLAITELAEEGQGCSISDLTVGLSKTELRQVIRTKCEGGELLATEHLSKKQLVDVLAVVSKDSDMATHERPGSERDKTHRSTKHTAAATQLKARRTEIKSALEDEGLLIDLLKERPYLIPVARSHVLKLLRKARGDLSGEEREEMTRGVLKTLGGEDFWEGKKDVAKTRAAGQAGLRLGMALHIINGMDLAECCKESCSRGIEPATIEQVQAAAAEASTATELRLRSDEALATLILLLGTNASTTDVCTCQEPRQRKPNHRLRSRTP